MELEFYGKLECEEFEFQNSGKSLYSSKTMVNHYIFRPIVVFGHFGQPPNVTLGKLSLQELFF